MENRQTWSFFKVHYSPAWRTLLSFLCVCVLLLSHVHLCNLMDCSPPRLLCPWNSPGKNTGVDCHSLLQGIFPSQGLNPGLLKSGRFFTICAIREDQVCFTHSPNQLRNPCYSNLSSYTLYHIILGIYNKCCVYRKI